MTVPIFSPSAKPDPIPTPTPASGVLFRHPRCQVYINSTLIPIWLEVTVTRGLDQDVATADIVVPYPLPSWVPLWARVTVLADAGGVGPIPIRFVGYFLTQTAALWPGAVTLHCEDILAIAKYTFTPVEMDLAGDTDVGAILRILGRPETAEQGGCGLPVSAATIHGTGEVLGDVDEANLFWEEGQTALEKVQDLDNISLGHRTFASAPGVIFRELLNTNPNGESEVHWFKEGIDIIDGSMSRDIIDPKNEITVAGWDGTVGTAGVDDDDAFAWRRNSYWIRFLMLKAAVEGAFVTPLAVATYILSQINRQLIKVTLTTHLDTYFEGQEVIGVTSKHLEVNQKFWVQSVQLTADSTGQFAQTITAISEIGPWQRRTNQPPVLPPVGVTPVVGPAPLPIPSPVVPVSDANVLVRFTVEALDLEMAAPADQPDNRGAAMYTVLLTDQSTSTQGTIVGWAWAISGPGVVVAESDQKSVTTAFTDLTGATATLTVTDSNGSQGSLTMPIPTPAAPLQARRLYSCTETTMEAYDGNVWRSREPVGGAVQVVGNGPYWGCGSAVAYSADDLVTAPAEVDALPGQTIISIWVHEQDAAFVAVGGDAGGIAFSADYGATWTARTSPGGAVNFLIVSIFDKTEWHAVTPTGWRKSQDQGGTWTTVRAGNFVYLELAPGRNIVIDSAGVLRQGETGTPFTGNTAPIVAATAHIRQDTFYAIADDGTTWWCEPGSFVLTQGADIPAGAPYVAGAYRDGQMVDLVYFAAQDGGLFKTLDGFRTPAGYLRLRDVGRLTP